MKIAVFPGSFDPFTLAHQDIVDRGLSVFDKIYIAIGINSSKKGMMEFETRKRAIENIYQGNNHIEVCTFSGLTIAFCQQVNAQFILRGLRNGKDLEYENAIAQNNLILAPEIETFFLLSRSAYSHISSTIVRDIWMNKGSISALVPAAVLEFMPK